MLAQCCFPHIWYSDLWSLISHHAAMLHTKSKMPSFLKTSSISKSVRSTIHIMLQVCVTRHPPIMTFFSVLNTTPLSNWKSTCYPALYIYSIESHEWFAKPGKICACLAIAYSTTMSKSLLWANTMSCPSGIVTITGFLVSSRSLNLADNNK